jgi:signal transduction histidine kinase
MLFERFKKLQATIRFRIMLWMIVVVVLLVALAMLGVRQIYGTRLLDDFDKSLRADVEAVAKEIRETSPDWARAEKNITNIALAHPLQAWFAEIYDAAGRKLAAGGFREFQPPLKPFGVNEVQAAHDMPPYRMIVARVEESGLPLYYVRIGADRSSLEDDMSRLDETMLVRSLMILVMAPVGGYVLALRATRPIAKIIATAARLEPSRLQERLPMRGTGDELDQLSQTINGMLDRIASYIDRNREFVANAAHELRSPLAAIRSSVEVALNRQRSHEEYATLLGEVMEECQYLSNLVNRLLILAEGDAGRLGARRQSARLDSIVRESLDMFEAVADLHGVRLEAGGLPAVLVVGEEVHLRQVVRNILDNAINFSPPGGSVYVALQIDQDKRQSVLTVRDHGIGISAEDLPHIFERFYRGDKARQRGPGRSSGLGLSICESIVQSLGGTITATSQPGQGSLFTVVLPISAEKIIDAQPRQRAEAPLA